MMLVRLALCLAALPATASASGCRDATFDGASYTLCEVTLAEGGSGVAYVQAPVPTGEMRAVCT